MSMSTDFTTILLRDFNNLLEEGVDHNVIIQAGEEPNTKSFRAHSGILRASQTFPPKFLILSSSIFTQVK
ncbi:unnamed protein product [Rhizophagus irregularis]|nr:unnamed protein product [Rhizophagus irregularis]